MAKLAICKLITYNANVSKISYKYHAYQLERTDAFFVCTRLIIVSNQKS